jgi:hypothetical protein
MAESSFCVFSYTCGRCSEVFTGIGKGDHAYGQLTARGAGTGQLICIDALADPVFDDVGLLVREVLAGSGVPLDGRTLGTAVQRAFPVACDPDAAGTPFVIGAPPRCPACAAAPRSWEHTGEHELHDVPEPSHRQWSALGTSQQRGMIREAVMDFLSE